MLALLVQGATSNSIHGRASDLVSVVWPLYVACNPTFPVGHKGREGQ